MTKLESTGPPAIAAPAMPAPASARVAAPAIMASRRLICICPPATSASAAPAVMMTLRTRMVPSLGVSVSPDAALGNGLRAAAGPDGRRCLVEHGRYVGRLRVEPAHAARGPVARAHVYQARHAANRAAGARRDHQRFGCFAGRAPRRGSGATGARHQRRVRRCRDRPARARLWPASEESPRQLDPCLAWPGHGPRRRLELGKSLHFLLRRRGVPEVPWAYAARQARRAGSGVLRECPFLL